MFEIIKRHPVRIAVIILLILIGLLLFLVLHYHFKIDVFRLVNFSEEQEFLIVGMSINNLSATLTFFGGLLGGIWGLIQYDKNIKLKQQETASKISKSFAGELTTQCSIIYNVIKNSDIIKLLELDQKKYNSFKTFTTNEMRIIYKDDEIIQKYKDKIEKANLDQIYYRTLESRVSFNKFKDLTEEKKTYSVEEAKSLLILDNKNYPLHFRALVSNVLNQLEYLCMSLSSQAAGSKYVYQSLHQVFLRTIRLLCVEIAISNNNYYSDKYYTSIIYVYNEWTKLYMKNLKKEKKQREKIDKILNPKIKTV